MFEGLTGMLGKWGDSFTDQEGLFQGGQQDRFLGRFRDKLEGGEFNSDWQGGHDAPQWERPMAHEQSQTPGGGYQQKNQHGHTEEEIRRIVQQLPGGVSYEDYMQYGISGQPKEPDPRDQMAQGRYRFLDSRFQEYNDNNFPSQVIDRMSGSEKAPYNQLGNPPGGLLQRALDGSQGVPQGGDMQGSVQNNYYDSQGNTIDDPTIRYRNTSGGYTNIMNPYG